MITREDIELLGFQYSDVLSTSDIETYTYIENRKGDKGKPYGTRNFYRLDKLVGSDYIFLVSDLSRIPEFQMFTRGYNGDIESIAELYNLFEGFKEANRKI